MVDQIRQKLQDAFDPVRLDVVDDSESHRGHAGFQEGGESHFNVYVRSASLGPMSRVARHRAVHAALGPEIIQKIHALALDLGGAE